jgi:hypothetical protein
MVIDTKTPQEKKRLSYEKDRRNTYGENSKASRKGISSAKARANRVERHTQDHVLATAVGLANSDELAVVENRVRATPPRSWRKEPDTPLGEVLARKVYRQQASGMGESCSTLDGGDRPEAVI